MVRNKSTDSVRWNYTAFALKGNGGEKSEKLSGVSKKGEKNPGSFKIFSALT